MGVAQEQNYGTIVKVETEVTKAEDVLKKALKEDESYRESWKFRLADEFENEYYRHKNESIQIDENGRPSIESVAKVAARKILDAFCRD